MLLGIKSNWLFQNEHLLLHGVTNTHKKLDFHFGIVKYNISKQSWTQRALPVLPQTQAPGVLAPGGLTSYLAPGLAPGEAGALLP